jgi:hypothetical protein
LKSVLVDTKNSCFPASTGFKTINAMSETAAEKPVPGNLSRVSWKLSRTVLRGGTNRKVGPLLDKNLGTKVKQPYNFGVADDALFAFAGLWERWRDSGQRIHRNLHNPNYQSKPPWLAAQLRIVALFDRSIERIHIDMDNFSHNQRVAK